MQKPETVWKLIAKKPYAAMAATLLILVQAVLNGGSLLFLPLESLQSTLFITSRHRCLVI